MKINLVWLAPLILLVSLVSCEEIPEGPEWTDINPVDSLDDHAAISDIKKVFSFAPENRYAYCPSVIEEGGVQHVFFCGNPEENRFVDHIYHMTIDSEGRTSEPRSVLEPTPVEGFWDDQHNCDPSVVAGRFGYRGDTYQYAMFFLGSNKDYYYNEIGVAFANSLDAGEWIKYDTVFLGKPWSGSGDFPIGDMKSWGIGQPDAITLDPENGDVLLTYTRGDQGGTRVVYRIISNMKKMENMIIGPEKSFPSQGIFQYQSSKPDYLSNAAIALDQSNDRFVMIRQMAPLSVLYPSFIHSYLEVTTIGTSDFYHNTGAWEPILEITPDETCFPRNHNPGLVRDPHGYMVGTADTMQIYYTTSLQEPGVMPEKGKYAEWTYTIWRAQINPEQDEQ